MNRRRMMLLVVAMSVTCCPLRTLAQQQSRVWRVGFLLPNPLSDNSRNVDSFLRGMRELGYIEGRNLIIERRSADGHFERLPGMAAELVQLKVDVIVAGGSPAIIAAQKATSTIPIVMASTGDPVGSGFVKSLARPGGNITGLSNMTGDTGAKEVDLLLATVPKLSRIGVLLTPTSATYRAISESVQAGAEKASVKTVVIEASTLQDIKNAFAAMSTENVGAVVVGAAPFFNLHRAQIADLAIQYRMPAIFGNRAYVEAGGLMSYGPRISDHYLRAANYVDKILKGAKPGDLPVEQPFTLELVINIKTARAIGLTIPPSLLARTDDLIQ